MDHWRTLLLHYVVVVEHNMNWIFDTYVRTQQLKWQHHEFFVDDGCVCEHASNEYIVRVPTKGYSVFNRRFVVNKTIQRAHTTKHSQPYNWLWCVLEIIFTSLSFAFAVAHRFQSHYSWCFVSLFIFLRFAYVQAFDVQLANCRCVVHMSRFRHDDHSFCIHRDSCEVELVSVPFIVPGSCTQYPYLPTIDIHDAISFN